MNRSSVVYLLSFLILSVEAFFLLGEKEPILFCIKVCPLYCTPRRYDDDASSLIYIDEPPYISYDHAEHEVIPYHFDPYYFCKPPKPTTTTTTTTPAPTTTTEEPTLICMVCMKKCTKYPKS